MLSTHFSKKEFTRSATGEKLGLDNSLSGEMLDNAKHTAERMEKVRECLGGKPVIVLSCYRSTAVNNAVGGSKTSAHMKALAVDFRVPKFGSCLEICKALVAAGIKFDQLILEFPERGDGAWVHIGFNRTSERGQILTATKQGGKTRYLMGLIA
ncbi:MAG: D-Ala-D-Ala carboxypeptidase family metallohydrolase [Shewanella sp.]